MSDNSELRDAAVKDTELAIKHMNQHLGDLDLSNDVHKTIALVLSSAISKSEEDVERIKSLSS